MNAEGKQEFICRQCSKVKCPIEKDDRHAVVDCKHFTHHPIIKNNTTPTETTAKHTPGPWKVVAELNGIEYTLIAKTPGKETERTSKFFVALFYGDAGSGDTKANAQLCASAPDLLAILKSMAAELNMVSGEPTMDGFSEKYRMSVEAAISKAQGE